MPLPSTLFLILLPWVVWIKGRLDQLNQLVSMVFVQTFLWLLKMGLESTLVFQGNRQSSAGGVWTATSRYPVNRTLFTTDFSMCLCSIGPILEILKIYKALKNIAMVTGNSPILIQFCQWQSIIRLAIKIIRSWEKNECCLYPPSVFWTCRLNLD